MKVSDAVAKRILYLCKERNISVNALAHLSAVPPSTIKNIIYKVSRNPGVATVKMICDGFDITLGDFFSSEEFDNLEQEIE